MLQQVSNGTFCTWLLTSTLSHMKSGGMSLTACCPALSSHHPHVQIHSACTPSLQCLQAGTMAYIRLLQTNQTNCLCHKWYAKTSKWNSSHFKRVVKLFSFLNSINFVFLFGIIKYLKYLWKKIKRPLLFFFISIYMYINLLFQYLWWNSNTSTPHFTLWDTD